MPTTYAIPNGRTVMDATIWSGDASSPRTITNQYGFQPDFVWVKNRSSDPVHTLWDSVRTVGSNKELSSATTTAEGSLGAYGTTAQYGYVSSLNSNGFGATTGSTSASYVNNSGSNYVGWQWQAGQGSNTTNTTGTVTSTVSANTTAGFSIVKWTMPASGSVTVGHGLGAVPSFIITKVYSRTENWRCYNVNLGNTKAIYLNTTAASTTDGVWGNTTPTASVFTIGTGYFDPADNVISYCWAPVAGFSQFGSYTGNGSSDGPFVYTGFRPKFVLLKRASGVDDWRMFDTSRDPYNLSTQKLYPNLAAAENGLSGESSSTNTLDILSNGFKLRTTNTGTNQSGETYIYACFAENPFKYANAR